MSKPLIIVVMCIYAFVAGEQLTRGQYAAALMWGAYSVANLGLFWMTK